MELFTLGIGNYTEQDIQEAARALTGWRVDGLTSYFDSNRFDNGTKTILGQTGNFIYHDVVDIIFTQPAAATFFSRELYSEFMHVAIDQPSIESMAQILRENNYELKPVLSTLLKSVMFHTHEVRGAKMLRQCDDDRDHRCKKRLRSTHPAQQIWIVRIHRCKGPLLQPRRRPPLRPKGALHIS